MTNTIIKENSITFKELEKNIFRKICQTGRNFWQWQDIKAYCIQRKVANDYLTETDQEDFDRF